MKQNYKYKIWVNGVEITTLCLLINVTIDYELGGRLPLLDMNVQCKNTNIAHHLISETSNIFIEAEFNKVKNRYSFVVLGGTMRAADNGIYVNISGVADLYNKPSLIATPIKQNSSGKTYEFIDKLINDDGKTANPNYTPSILIKKLPEGWSMESKVHKLDMIGGKSVDTTVRNFSGITKLQAINEVISSSKLSGEKPIAHYFSHNLKTGALDLTLFDICLRCKSFQPKTIQVDGGSYKQSFGTKPEYIRYDQMRVEIKGAEYSTEYWQRGVDSYANDEVVRFNTGTDNKAMFSDGMDYPTKDVVLDAMKPITEFPMLRSGVALKKTLEPTDDKVDLKISNTRANYLRYIKAINKINVIVKTQNYIPIQIGDIYEVHFPDYMQKNVDDKLLSGNYMVTRVITTLQDEAIQTFVVLGRDSYVKGSTK